MATYKRGDTWPPLRGRAADESGLIDLPAAEFSVVNLKLASGVLLVSGTVAVLDPAENAVIDGEATQVNWEYVWQEDDLDTVGIYHAELQITWDSGTTPPQIQTVPSSGFETFEVEDDVD